MTHKQKLEAAKKYLEDRGLAPFHWNPVLCNRVQFLLNVRRIAAKYRH